MAQTIQECLDYLAAARESVEELSLAADREEQLKQDESRLKKALEIVPYFILQKYYPLLLIKILDKPILIC